VFDEVSVPRHDIPRGGRSGFALVDRRQVHYLEWGQVRKPAVLALHGGGQTAYMYEELGDALAPDHYVLAPDLPGHGDSEALPEFGRHEFAATIPPLLEFCSC
jgi:magnesium chelatase accessory protein